MSGMQCPTCGALTSTGTGACDVCKAPLPVGDIVVEYTPAPPPPYGASPSAAQGYGAPAYPPPAYPAPQPAYGSAGYGQTYPAPYAAYPAPYPATPPPYGYPPGYGYVPVTYEPLPKRLGKDASGDRWVAAIVDCFVIVPVCLALVFTISFLSGAAALLLFLLAFTLFIAYYAALDGAYGQTLGKRAMRVKVVNEQLGPITGGQGLARALELFLWLIAGGLILIWVQSTSIKDDGQGLGDELAKTYVVRISDLIRNGYAT